VIAATRKHMLSLLADSPAAALFMDRSRQSFSRTADALFIFASALASWALVQAAAAGAAAAAAWWHVEWI
jgi:hypothetical protein